MWIQSSVFWMGNMEIANQIKQEFSLHDSPGIFINLGSILSLSWKEGTLKLRKNQFVILPSGGDCSLVLFPEALYLYAVLDHQTTGILPVPLQAVPEICFGEVLSLGTEEAASVLTLSRKLLCGYQEKDWGYYHFRSSWISEILMNVLKCAYSVSGQHQDSTLIHRIILYLNENFTEKTSIDMLAEKFYISKYHLMRQFKKETGYTIHGFILHKRIKYACHLIQAGTSPSEACYRSGFTDYSLFFKSFTKMTGFSPSHYIDMLHSQTG